MSDMTALLDTADRIAATDLYPARCRMVIADLAAALRAMAADLQEAREYGSALVEELAARAAKTDRFVALATNIDADFEAFVDAVKALGAMPEGYCFCSKDRIGDDSKAHEHECRDIRALINRRTE